MSKESQTIIPYKPLTTLNTAVPARTFLIVGHLYDGNKVIINRFTRITVSLPPSTQLFAGLVGEHGASYFVEKLIKGEIDIDALDFPIHVMDWLKTLQKEKTDKELEPLPNFVGPKEFATEFKEVDEITSSSPSGLHYTLWKGIVEKEDFSAYLSIIMSLPFMYGFTNKRWDTAIKVMLEKK